MRTGLSVVIVAALIVSCERKEPAPAAKTPEAASPAAEVNPPRKTGEGPIHSTDVPTVSELAAIDPRTGKVMAKLRDLIVKQLDVSPDKVVPEAGLRKDLGADDLDIVELIMAMEEEFNLSIRDEDAEKIQTFGDAVETLLRLGAR